MESAIAGDFPDRLQYRNRKYHCDVEGWSFLWHILAVDNCAQLYHNLLPAG